MTLTLITLVRLTLITIHTVLSIGYIIRVLLSDTNRSVVVVSRVAIALIVHRVALQSKPVVTFGVRGTIVSVVFESKTPTGRVGIVEIGRTCALEVRRGRDELACRVDGTIVVVVA